MAKQKWVFEPGHTAAEFSARHMMVSNVRGHFKNIALLKISNNLAQYCHLLQWYIDRLGL